MKTLKGTGISDKISFGKAKIIKREDNFEIKKINTDNFEKQITRYRNAIKFVKNDLDELIKGLNKDNQKENCEILDMQKMMIEDVEFTSFVENQIKNENVTAEYAVTNACKKFSNLFLSSSSKYIENRIADIKDISKRLINSLKNCDKTSNQLPNDTIIFIDNILPSELLEMENLKISGIVTKQGSENSHSSIIMKTMQIPAVINTGQDVDLFYDKKDVILDAISGKVYLNPDKNTADNLIKKEKLHSSLNTSLQYYKGKADKTKDGKIVKIYSNAKSLEDIDSTIKNDASGIGLFRSEFLYINKDKPPSEEEQFIIYKNAAIKMCNKPIIIRTLDIGSDKKAKYMNLPKEENPALGHRGIRVSLDNPKIFKDQIKAIYRASHFGEISLMLPMITSLSEVIEAKKFIKEVQSELDLKNINYRKNLNLGIMIETPASVMISDKLAKEVNFFSIGTNDLIQYTFATDRQNSKIPIDYTAIFRMIKIVVENAHKNNIWVGVCGELAGNENFIEALVQIGVDELSVAPKYVLKIRKKLMDIKFSGDKNILL